MNYSAVVLAGGQSRRMGRDKATMILGGRSLLAHQIETLKRLAPTRILCSVAAGQTVESLECSLIQDEEPNLGPLGAIHTVLTQTSDPFLLVLAVDMPRMTSDYFHLLLKRCETGCGAVPMRGQGYEPLAAVYPREALRLAKSALARRNYSMQRFVSECVEERCLSVVPITAEEEDLFANWNRPEDAPLAF